MRAAHIQLAFGLLLAQLYAHYNERVFIRCFVPGGGV